MGTEDEYYRVLADVTAAVTESLVLETAMERLAQVVVPRLADWCVVHLLDADQKIRRVAISHADPSRVEWARRIDETYGPSADSTNGVVRVARTGVPEFYAEIGPDMLRAAARDEHHYQLLRSAGFAAAVLMPLKRRDRVLGVLTLVAEGDRRFSEYTMQLAAEVSRRAAVAVENATLYQAAEQARAETQETNRTLERLWALSPILASNMDEVAAARAVARAAREAFAGGSASVWRFVSDELELLARDPQVAHLVPGVRVALRDFPAFRQEVSVARPSFVPDLVAAYPMLERRAALIGAVSLLCLPLPSADGPAGVVIVTWPEMRPEPAPALLAVGQRFADVAALAFEDGQRRRAERVRGLLHMQLEASLVPTPHVARSRLRVHTRYQSGEEGMMLAGDFLDAYELADGSVRAVIGDVSGRGPVAAALAASLRAAWRALTKTGMDQVAVLRELDGIVHDDRGADDMFATVCSITVTPTDDGCYVATAGHPLPILFGQGWPSPVSAPVNPPLGTGTADSITAGTVELPSGWALMLYTDGLTDVHTAPAGSERLDTDGLLDWLTEHAPQAPDNATLDRLLSFPRRANGGRAADDLAILLLAQLQAA